MSSRGHRFGACLAMLIVLASAGCARAVEQADLTGLSKASGEIRKQADLAFTDANRLARNVAVDRFVRSRRIGLVESEFAAAVPADSIRAWQSALGRLELYASLLASLVDERRGAGASDAVTGLARQLEAGRTGLEISPGVGAAFSSLAGALVNARAQSRAADILRATDPHVQSLLQTMASAIGESDARDLRGTVWSNWEASFEPIRRAYIVAAERGDEPRQRALVADYLAALDRRDAQIAALASLRSSLLNLAAAHGAAAAGQAASLDTVLGAVAARLEETKRIYAAFEAGGARGDEVGSDR